MRADREMYARFLVLLILQVVATALTIIVMGLTITAIAYAH
ncbi:MAG: hypothetical protein QOA14_11345 [Nitrososphaeraceae archaeon]|jgi:hypothetical protein|nr:hypothetical protein [Nitrososphaeraceae archaeon]MDW0178936.1 hypothetical protein [Nitrososphaeraceae archaeon]MDW0195536.1 hypothetical protein [Nitrososphaeraceae archaeon]MDW0208554.1 hypothetical protein [Nitrososphaeraceae archaeon]MDW0212417.1 hypothetical protein [Nitrososphaeraceae archaeon]